VNGQEAELDPHDTAAEQAVLGAMLMSPDAITDVTKILAPEHHHLPAHQIIHEAILGMRKRGEPVDALTVKARLEADGTLGKTGDAGYLHTLLAAVPTVANAGYYAQRVADLAERRDLLSFSRSLAQRALSPGADIGDIREFLRRAAEKSGRGHTASAGRRIVLTAASEIQPEPVVWAWEDDGHGRIPAGSMGLAAGREGTGKSSFAIWMAAKVTRGALPGSFGGKPRDVIYVAVEDSWKYTIVPRLMAAGADLARVHRAEVQTIENDTVSLSLPADNRLLEAIITGKQVAMIVLDPLMSAISDTLDTHVNRQVRQALDPLARIADRTGAVILGIAHFSKAGGTDVSSLITGSGAFKDVARFIFGFAAEEDDDAGGVITQTKNSLGRSGLPSLAYRIIEATVPTAKGDARVGRFVLEGVSERSAADILGSYGGAGERDEKTRAEDFLRKALAGGIRRSKDIEEEALEVHGISLRTLKRARADLRIPAVRRESGPAGRDGRRKVEWWVALPEHEGDLREPYVAPDEDMAKGANGASSPGGRTLGTLGTLDGADEPKGANGATLECQAETTLTSQECQSAKSATLLEAWPAHGPELIKNPRPDCAHQACWDALLGKCLAGQGFCLTCGRALDPKLAAAGDTTHPNCGEASAA